MTHGVAARLGNWLDQAGLRRLVALAATAAYRFRGGTGQHFSVTSDGKWINRQPEATIVSPTIHTAPFSVVEEEAIDHWAWQYCPQHGDVVIDVGAGVGEDTLVFSKLVGSKGLVVSVEANPETFASLKETVARSAISNVRAVSGAVAARDGSVRISNSPDHWSNSLFSDSGSVEVPSRSLDSLSDELGLGAVALLKMNIEGAERFAVDGMSGLARRLSHVVVSCHDFIAERGGSGEFRTFSEVRRKLEELGFETCARTDDTRPWVRYYVYGRNKALRIAR
jgi:FkbM family methyltransferase